MPQLIGDALQETTILNAAYAYEQSTAWHRQRPNAALLTEEEEG